MVLGNARRGYWDRNSSRQRPHHRAFLQLAADLAVEETLADGALDLRRVVDRPQSRFVFLLSSHGRSRPIRTTRPFARTFSTHSVLTGGDVGKLSGYAAELVALKPDAIFVMRTLEFG
jgi:hypothetical protein